MDSYLSKERNQSKAGEIVSGVGGILLLIFVMMQKRSDIFLPA